LDRGLELFDPNHRSLYAGLTVDDVQVVMLYYSSWASLYLGEIDQARARCTAAMTVARRLAQPYSLAHVLIASCLIKLVLHAFSGALERLREIQLLAEEHGISYFAAIGTIFRGRCLASLGREQEGIELLTRGIAGLRASGNVLYLPTFLTFLAGAYGRAGKPEEGLMQLADAAKIVEATQTHCDEAEMHRVKGELLVALNQPMRAEQSFREAVAVAQRQRARSWELRATMSLAKFWQGQGKRCDARAALLPVYDWFSEGGDTPLLKEARVLLDGLA
jgi:predicted ATPase